MKTIRVHHERE